MQGEHCAACLNRVGLQKLVGGTCLRASITFTLPPMSYRCLAYRPTEVVVAVVVVVVFYSPNIAINKSMLHIVKSVV